MRWAKINFVVLCILFSIYLSVQSNNTINLHKLNLHFIWQINTHINELQHFILGYLHNVIRALRPSPVPATLLVIIILVCSVTTELRNWHDIRGRKHWRDRNSTTATSTWAFGWFNFDDFIIKLGSIQLKQVT